LLVALALALLAGCGGGGGDAAGTSAGGEASGTGAEGAARTTQSAERARAQQGSGSGAAGTESGGATPTPSGPLPNEGTKQVAPGVPTAKGGDNSIQKFGTESASTDRVAATRALKTYLDARAAGAWAGACARVSAGLKAEFSAFGGESPQGKPARCTEVLPTLTTEVPASALRAAAAIHVLSMRVKGSQAYLVYKNGEGTPSAIPMTREGGEWKVAALDGSALLL
jgi:hypothetical protein